MSPLFSVIVPTYNRPQLLRRALRSVLNQSFADFELLVVDDASTEDVGTVVEAMADERIRYLRREEKGGAATCRNAGIRQAQGQYVAFLDDDDEYLPDFLAEMERAFQAAPAEVGLGWCGVLTVRKTAAGEEIVTEGAWQPSFENREQAYRSFLRARQVGSCGLTARRACFERVGLFDEALPKAEDTEFLIRAVRQVDFLVVPRTLVKVYLHGGERLTTYDDQMAGAYEHILQKNLTALNDDPALWASLHYKTGWLHYHAGNKSRGRYYMGQALRRSPLHWKSWIGMLLFELFGTRAPQVHRQLSLSQKKLRALISR